jgi:hypothetical protein
MTTRNKLDAISIYYALERAGMAGAFKSHEVEDMASGLAKAARALDRINLDRCNGISRWDNTHKMRISTWLEEDEARADWLEARYRAAATAIVDRLNGSNGAAFFPESYFPAGKFAIRFGGDPRGASIKLYVAPDDPESGNASAYF